LISKKLPATMMTGGLSDTKPATPDVQHIVNQVSCNLSKGEVSVFAMVVGYRQQSCAGSSCVNNTSYVHLRVFQSLPHENQGPSLVSFETGKTRDDPLTYFER
uniref:Uncharacterized protein n=1 Tax=Otus sunia TaxID=257818 RepID=A0A8C8B013_9STRI